MSSSGAVKKYPKYYYKHPLTRHSTGPAPIETQRVYSVLTADQLLKQRGRRKVLDEVRVTCGAPIEYFNGLYKKTIENFAEFIQHLPLANNPRLCRLDKQLHVASLALSLREPYLLAGELLNRTTDKEKALWNWVIFSGLLLGRLSEIVNQYNVSVCDEKGIYIKTWEPFAGPMSIDGSYYKIRSIESKKTSIDSQINVLLARQLMPEEGYNWIARNPEALEQWIETLDSTGEREADSLVARFFVVLESWLSEQNRTLEGEAEAILEKYLEELLQDLYLKEDNDEELPPLVGTEPEETLIGERFYQWLRKGIQDKTISVNQPNSAIFITAQGALLLHPAIFKTFIQQNPGMGQPQQVFDQFSKLGLIANNRLENYVAKFPGLREQDVKGVLLKDMKTLFGENQPPPLTPYILKAVILKHGTEARLDLKMQIDQRQTEAKHKAEYQDELAQERSHTNMNRPPKR